MSNLTVLIQQIDKHLACISVKDIDVFEMVQARSKLKNVYDILSAVETNKPEPQEENNG